jgi:hypothetical protein
MSKLLPKCLKISFCVVFQPNLFFCHYIILNFSISMSKAIGKWIFSRCNGKKLTANFHFSFFFVQFSTIFSFFIFHFSFFIFHFSLWSLHLVLNRYKNWQNFKFTITLIFNYNLFLCPTFICFALNINFGVQKCLISA